MSVELSTLNFELKKPDCIGGEVNFQTEEQERNDSQSIESRAIQILHSMKKKKSKRPDADRVHLNKFVALHMSRSTRDIENLKSEGIDFVKAKDVIFKRNLLFVSAFPEVLILHLDSSHERLILSDQPVVKMKNQILFPFAPKVLICFTGMQGPGSFEDRTWSEAMNEMSIQNSVRGFFCNPDNHPDLAALKERSKERSLISVERQGLIITV